MIEFEQNDSYWNSIKILNRKNITDKIFGISLKDESEESPGIPVEKMESVLKEGCSKRLVYLTLEKQNNPGNPLLLHEEPIYMDNKIVGKTSSGQYSFNYNKSISMGHVRLNENFKLNDIKNNQFEIEVAKKRYEAKINLQPLHDPKNILIKK